MNNANETSNDSAAILAECAETEAELKRMIRDAIRLSDHWAHVGQDDRSNDATRDIATRRAIDYSNLARRLESRVSGWRESAA